ncbi:hypothetical protein [Methylobacterium sp. Leaf466]|nr:hypothetical protein [Methylobacterium sp. Leaf466]
MSRAIDIEAKVSGWILDKVHPLTEPDQEYNPEDSRIIELVKDLIDDFGDNFTRSEIEDVVGDIGTEIHRGMQKKYRDSLMLATRR